MQIQNPSAGMIIREEAGLTLAEGFPNELSRSVIPTMDMTPSFHRKTDLIKSATRTTTGSGTVHSTHAVAETYITGIFLSLVKDVSADTASNDPFVLTAVINGVSTNLARVGVLTLTAQNQSIYIKFANPILVDKGTNMTITGAAFTAGSVAKSGTIYGYEVQ